jgi:FixJ family two-component response regulator
MAQLTDPSGQHTIALIDDDPAVLKSLARLLGMHDFHCVSYDSPEPFLAELETLDPNCIIADISMPTLTGLELQQALIARNVIIPIIFVTGQNDISSSVKAMRRGAVDYLSKPFDFDSLLDAVARALDRDRTGRNSQSRIKTASDRLATLTRREREVFNHVVCGLLNKQIAGKLDITEKTVKVHRARVMQKMKARSVAQLARTAEMLAIHEASQAHHRTHRS